MSKRKKKEAERSRQIALAKDNASADMDAIARAEVVAVCKETVNGFASLIAGFMVWQDALNQYSW